jgi:hypothetical protein
MLFLRRARPLALPLPPPPAPPHPRPVSARPVRPGPPSESPVSGHGAGPPGEPAAAHRPPRADAPALRAAARRRGGGGGGWVSRAPSTPPGGGGDDDCGAGHAPAAAAAAAAGSLSAGPDGPPAGSLRASAAGGGGGSGGLFGSLARGLAVLLDRGPGRAAATAATAVGNLARRAAGRRALRAAAGPPGAGGRAAWDGLVGSLACPSFPPSPHFPPPALGFRPAPPPSPRFVCSSRTGVRSSGRGTARAAGQQPSPAKPDLVLCSRCPGCARGARALAERRRPAPRWSRRGNGGSEPGPRAAGSKYNFEI